MKQTWHKLDLFGNMILNWEYASFGLPSGSLWGIFTILGYCGRAQLIVDRDTPGQVALGYMRRQAERAIKQHSFFLSS